MLASRFVRHFIVELEVAVEFDGNVHLSDGELLVWDGCRRSTVDFWGRSLISGSLTLDTLAVGEGTLGQTITFSEAVLAAVSTELHSTVVAERTSVQIPPAVTRLLLSVTLIVGVGWAVERSA